MKKKYIYWLKEISAKNVKEAGGKNASLGEMYNALKKEGIKVPEAFVLTSSAYFYFLEKADLTSKIKSTLKGLNINDLKDLQKRGAQVRKLILEANFPTDLENEIRKAYQKLSQLYQRKNVDVAVRSSGTAEDLATASFAGQHETFLNIRGEEELLQAIKKCFASLFTNRAISYREDKGFDHFSIGLSVGVQKMVRSDLACSGVIFTLDTESGFPDVVVITGSWGLGEMIVQGKVIPDEFWVYKKTLKQGYQPVVKKTLGTKDKKLIYQKNGSGTQLIKVPLADQKKFILNQKEIIQLAQAALAIEKHYSQKAGQWRPMDIEWAKDGEDGQLYIVQARPETVHSQTKELKIKEFHLKNPPQPILEGIAIGQQITAGKVNVIEDASRINEFKEGEILVTKVTDPDWEPIMKIARAIITDEGGRTSHAAIVSRELGVPCIVGTKKATKTLKDGDEITLDCSQGGVGKVYRGLLKWKEVEHSIKDLPKTKTKIVLNLGDPESAFKYWVLPVEGVGLAREEFIFTSGIKIHPLALLHPEKIKSQKERKKIENLTAGYPSKKNYFIEKLAEGIAQIACVFYPKEVIVRFSDFKTNEYASLIGGQFFEPKEENPMLGWRGVSRYYDEKFKEAFILECKAIKKARNEFGLKNVSVMLPFCRTTEEGKKVLEIIRKTGLKLSSDNGLKVYVMCEIPANVILADEFLEIFDGFSIGSNDLTQLTLGIDRDNAHLSKIADERNEAVKKLIAQAIKKCREKRKYVGICGQAPSDYPEFAQFLVEKGIEAISVNPDVVIKTILLVAEKEKKNK